MTLKEPPVFSRQQRFLAQLQEVNFPVSIYLKNGIKLQGMISAFDDHVIILRCDGISQMVYKQAISTLSPRI